MEGQARIEVGYGQRGGVTPPFRGNIGHPLSGEYEMTIGLKLGDPYPALNGAIYIGKGESPHLHFRYARIGIVRVSPEQAVAASEWGWHEVSRDDDAVHIRRDHEPSLPLHTLFATTPLGEAWLGDSD